jgi:hypothetical protein
MGTRSEVSGAQKSDEVALEEGRGRNCRCRYAWSVRKACIAVVVVLCALGITQRTAAQAPASSSPEEPAKKNELGSLKVCLRLEDETPFVGAASVRVAPENGDELMGIPSDLQGDVIFYGVAAGKYLIEVTAPGFLPVTMNTEVGSGNREHTVFVVLKTRKAPTDGITISGPGISTDATSATKAEAAKAETKAEKEKEREKEVPLVTEEPELPVDTSVACPLDQILHGAGERMKEFVGSMEKFTATETVEHYVVDKAGDRKGPDTRKFAYVVVVARARNGAFWLEEFRNGTTDREQFPGNIATLGLPAIALVFHPDYVRDFNFKCDGLVHSAGREYWQVHFAQKLDQPVRIETYMVNGMGYPVYLKGRAWIDPGRSEIVRLRSELEKPIIEIELTQQRQEIYYTAVKFASTGQEIWLPEEAEVYVERHGKRYYRRHTFKDFRLFNVDTSQNVKTPKGSYSFTNLTDNDMTGELTVTPAEGFQRTPITLRFSVPAHRTVVKTVGPGKDVSLPPAEIGSAKFVHTGNAGSVRVDVDLVKETTLDVIPQSAEE